MRLEPDQLVELADLVAERLAGCLGGGAREASSSDGLVDAAAVARALGVGRDYVYRHAARLGGRRVGEGPRPRWRFDLEVALARGASGSAGREHEGAQTGAATSIPRVRRRRGTRSSARLLPIRGVGAAVEEAES